MSWQDIKRFFASLTLEKLVPALVILAVGFALVKLLMKLFDRLSHRSKLDHTAFGFLRTLLRVLLDGIVILIAASSLGVDVSSLIAVLGVVSLGISLAVQSTLTNVVGSLTILTSRPFRVGDHVQIGEQSGIVREIGMTYTCIETFSGQTVYLPNSSASTACIVNYSEQGRRRLDIDVAASYEDDAEAVKAALLRAADCSYRLADTPTFVGIKSYADSGILYELQLWVKSDEYLSARFAVNEAVKRCFEEDGINFPYPHVELVTK